MEVPPQTAPGETSHMPPPPDIQLQACNADTMDVSEYRYLVDGSDIKYIQVDPDVIPADDITSESALQSLLPAFPPGNWNEGHVVTDPATGHAVFAQTARRDFPGVQNVWHGTKIDHLQLTWVGRKQHNVRLVTCPLFAHPVVYKFAEFPWQTSMVEHESTAYSWIDGQGIGPRFLAHVTEAGRFMGFLVENIPGRAAGIEDLDARRLVLRKMHRLRLKHGDFNKHNVLIEETGEAVLVDFEATVRCDNNLELLFEYETVEKKLQRVDHVGGRLLEEHYVPSMDKDLSTRMPYPD